MGRKSAWPTPRMKTAADEVDPPKLGLFWKVRLGVKFCRSSMADTARTSRSSWEKAEMEIGVVSRLSSRLRAVTMISSRTPRPPLPSSSSRRCPDSSTGREEAGLSTAGRARESLLSPGIPATLAARAGTRPAARIVEARIMARHAMRRPWHAQTCGAGRQTDRDGYSTFMGKSPLHGWQKRPVRRARGRQRAGESRHPVRVQAASGQGSGWGGRTGRPDRRAAWPQGPG